MVLDQLTYYQKKLAYEMDSADLFSALREDRNIIVVDGRTTSAFDREHIPSAINLPHREMCTNSTSFLDKSKTYICYCDGIGCNASTKAALKLLTLGCKVKELIGGIDWWKRDGYATEGENAQAGTAVDCGC